MVDATKFINYFVIINFLDSFSVNVQLIKLLTQELRLLQLRLKVFLQIFLNLLLEAEACFAILLFDSLDKISVLFLQNFIFNVLLQVEPWHGERVH